MAFSNFNLADVLKQFTRGQKIFVLVFSLGIISITTITTTYFTTQCGELMAINETLIKDLEGVKKSIAECQTYNETLIHNNLLIIERTSELHLRLLGNSEILQSQSLTILPDSIEVENLKTMQLIETPITEEEKTDKLMHEIMEIAKAKTKK